MSQPNHTAPPHGADSDDHDPDQDGRPAPPAGDDSPQDASASPNPSPLSGHAHDASQIRGSWASCVARLRRAETKRRGLVKRLAEPSAAVQRTELGGHMQRWLIPLTAAATVGTVSAIAAVMGSDRPPVAAVAVGVMAGAMVAVVHEGVRLVAMGNDPAAATPRTLGIAMVPAMTTLGGLLGLMGAAAGLPWPLATSGLSLALVMGATVASGLCFGVLASAMHHRWRACFATRAARYGRQTEVLALRGELSEVEREIEVLQASIAATVALGLAPLGRSVARSSQIGWWSAEHFELGGRH